MDIVLIKRETFPLIPFFFTPDYKKYFLEEDTRILLELMYVFQNVMHMYVFLISPGKCYIKALHLYFINFRWFSNPLGKYLQFKETSPQPPVPNAVLEREFLKHSKILPEHHVIQVRHEENVTRRHEIT